MRYTRLAMPAQTVNILPAPGNSGQSQRFVMHQRVPRVWWGLFRSTQLNQLVAQGLQNNPTLVQAKATLQQSQATLAAAIGTLFFPKWDLDTSAKRSRTASIQYGVPIPATIFSVYAASLEVSYTLDLFGKERRAVEVYRAQVDYAQYEWMAAYLTLTTNITTTWITLASLQAQIREIRALIQAQKNIVSIVKRQLKLGGVAEKEVLVQQTLLAQIKAQLPPLEKALSQTEHVMAVFIGKPTSESGPFRVNLDSVHLPTQLPVSLPSVLVQQRPDIQAASALVHVASAKIGIATANLLPQINLTAGYGWLSPILSQLFTPMNTVWEYGAQLLEPVFRGGALWAEKRAALAGYQGALAGYQQTVLQAFKDVSDALRAIEIDAYAFQDRMQAEKTAQETLRMIQQQFRLGGENFLSVLNAQKQYEEIRVQRIEAQAARYLDTVALFQALGGGW